tara:strand:- start:230 stop:784 length:555 start_codon:yes stop_codon:yes gene_type:complete
MNFTKFPTNLSKYEIEAVCNQLKDSQIPDISLPAQNGNLLRLFRTDTFRLVIYCFPMTGHPDKPLPKNWNKIPGAKGCSLQNCTFRDNYNELIVQNSLPIGISTQSVEDLREMTIRLKIPYDILSDNQLKFAKSLKLPTFSIENKIFIERLTLIIEKSVIQHVFYPIFQPEKHIDEVLDWLSKN